MAKTLVGFGSMDDFKYVARAARIAHNDVGTNRVPRDCNVSVIPLPMLLGKTNANISAGNSGTFVIWDGANAASVSASNTATETAYVRQPITSGKFCYLLPVNDSWYEAVPAEC